MISTKLEFANEKSLVLAIHVNLSELGALHNSQSPLFYNEVLIK